MPDGLTVEALTEESALALEGDALLAAATELSVCLFRSPPFQEKAEQPKRRVLALVYEKLGVMGKAESCAREARRPTHRPWHGLGPCARVLRACCACCACCTRCAVCAVRACCAVCAVRVLRAHQRVRRRARAACAACAACGVR